MRVTTAQRQAIESAFREAFGPGSRLLLYGSRLDDSARGGDIDLCVEAVSRPWAELVKFRLAFLAALERSLGERRIDVLLKRIGDTPRPIDLEVERHGVELCQIPA